MLDRVEAPPVARAAVPGGPRVRRGSPSRRTTAALGLLAAGWAVVLLAHLAHADLVVLPLLVVGTAALLRTGGTLLDRLVIAAGAVAGGALAAGLLFSVWPWGLHPVAVGGFGWSVLVAAGWAARRAPALPRRVTGGDLVVLGTGLGAWLMAAWPTVNRPAVDALAFFAGNDTGDRLRQFSMFDAVLRFDGYPFLDPGRTHDVLVPGMATNYPGGTGFLYALVDSFRTSGGPTGDGVAEAHRYYGLLLGGYALLALVVVWAARWVAGHRAAGWRGVLVLTAIGTFVATGIMTAFVWYGFDSQVLGLVFTALTVALLVRYPDRPVEQTVVAGLALTGVAFTYPLYVPALGVAAAVTLWGMRARLKTRPVATAAALLCVAPLVLLPIAVPRLAGDFHAGSHLLLRGPIVQAPRHLLFAATALVTVVMTVTTARRAPTQRLMAVQVAAAASVACGLWLYQRVRIGASSYYLEKLLYAWLVTALIALGGSGTLLRGRGRQRRAPAATGARLWLRRGTAALAAALAGVLIAGGVSFGRPEFASGRPAENNTWGRVWAAGLIVSPAQNELVAMQRRRLLGDGTFTMVVLRHGRSDWQSALVTMQAAAMNHQLGRLEDYVATMPLVPVDKEEARSALDPMWYVSRNWADNLEIYARKTPTPLRIVSFEPDATTALTAAAARNPCRCVRVVPVGPGVPPVAAVSAAPGRR
ncbi:hypothetical protein [Yinghuangia seranimata]|uniref:hypothetical protein n=1 Tax=Yinghuangia seranimata TaxID=408067 RepID=UPI00248C0812|nr:hypothetical protein [Yinghuangia seranimata]MDI2127392.1 hypothetical protein [Yinghuangia seranimata]